MIAVVEGLSAAGKTTWCNRNFPEQTVWEAPILGDAPNRVDEPQTASRYWAQMNAKRWSDATSIESESGLAICDTDPFKLHYIFSLWQIGAQSRADWDVEVEIHRDLFASEQVGLADMYFVTIPDRSTLLEQKTGDVTRSRKSFDLHSQLGSPLELWYKAIDSLDPGRVVWNFPDSMSTEDVLRTPVRTTRSGVELFDQLLAKLPHCRS